MTIIPTGGLDKVATFISLLRGNELNIACFLDTFSDPKGKGRLDDMIKHKLIRQNQVHFVHDFLGNCKYAEVEDLFT
ncbi:MAG: hypothetical protein ACP5EN_17805, partial [Rhodovulum sp.]